jgi:hypothetical protein
MTVGLLCLQAGIGRVQKKRPEISHQSKNGVMYVNAFRLWACVNDGLCLLPSGISQKLRVRRTNATAFRGCMAAARLAGDVNTSNRLQAIPKLRLRLPLKFHKSQSTMVWPGMATR